MTKKTWVVLLGVILMLFSMIFSSLNVSADSVSQTSKVKVKIIKGDGYVDIPIEDLGKEDIVIEKTEDGRYEVTITDKDGNEEKQYVTEEEAKDLGYIEDILDKDMTKDKEITIEKTEDGKYEVTITDKDGNEIKQVITEEEAKELGYIKDILEWENKEKNEVEKQADGRYVVPIKKGKGKGLKQVITEEEAKELGYEEHSTGYLPGGQPKDGKNDSGLLMPDTFSGVYNVIIFGGILTLIGFIIVVVRKKLKG